MILYINIVRAHSWLCALNFSRYLFVFGKRILAKYQEFPAGHGELILVVDHEDSIQKITQSWLEQNAYKVLVASDGIDTIALYTKY
ncbi:MAG: hypothetical protein V7K89_04455 [Nostoc sp.]|uniref:hypothetical protein n=1 Tax=Nostoc sp. TaxID=1180 RepID=UPI002FFB45B1